MLILLLLGITNTAQDLNTSTLSFAEYLSHILDSHPVVRQGDLLIERGTIAILEARGQFDPKLSADLSEKKFKEDPYYSLFNTQVEVPTKLGVKVKAGYDRTSGAFLNPQDNDPDGGLVYAGVTVPLGRGLLIDERRAQLQKAEFFRQISAISQRQLINDLVYDASTAYWQWWLSHEQLLIFDTALANAALQLEAVRQSALAGDRAYIDTVEARIQYQNLVIDRTQAQLDFATASLYLSTFLWDEEGAPQMIRESTTPAVLNISDSLGLSPAILTNTTSIIQDHPEILSYDLKIKQLEISRRIAKEYLKPEVNIKYNFLVDAGKSLTEGLSTNNYTWGIEMRLPLLFRKEQAKIQMTDITIADNEIARTMKSVELRNKVHANIAKWNAYFDQFKSYQEIVEDYQSMLSGEQQLFNSGESSQFLLNSRQAKYIEANLKLKELYAKIRISEVESYYSAGVLLVDFN